MEGLIVKENSPWHDFVLSYIFMEPLSWQSFCITHIAEDSGGWWWKGRPGMLRFMGLQRVGHGWVTELNWYHKGILELKLCFNKPNHVLLEAKASKSGQNPVAWQPGWKGLLPESTDTSAFWVEDRRLELRSEKDWFPPTVSAVYLPVTRCSSSRQLPPCPSRPSHSRTCVALVSAASWASLTSASLLRLQTLFTMNIFHWLPSGLFIPEFSISHCCLQIDNLMELFPIVLSIGPVF